MKLLQVNNLNKAFGGLKAVNDVTFHVEKDFINAIIGPNGAGKTTLFNLISGNLVVDSGEVIYNGLNIEKYPPHKIASIGISRTFQNIKLFSNMTVLENVMVGKHIKSKAGFLSGMLNFPSSWKEEKSIHDKSFELLEMLGLSDIADEDAESIAFGKQRIVEFARALAAEPELLILDEPAAGLNIYETAEIAEIIKKIRGQGITILIIEHDMSLIMDISDNIVVLNSGEKIAEGTPEEIQKNKEVVKVYLGDDDA
jgi:branched-chain amino acid transport system ATP-binding protein